MRPKNWIIKEVNAWLGNPKDWSNSQDDTRLKMIWAGVIKEYIPEITSPELAKASGAKSHAAPLDWIKGWQSLPWTTRHAWLAFFMGTHPDKLYAVALAADPAFKHVTRP